MRSVVVVLPASMCAEMPIFRYRSIGVFLAIAFTSSKFAPPAVAGVAYFALIGGTNSISAALGGYAVLMAVAQLRFIPLYARLRFSVGFWAFTFPYAVGATDALLWLTATRPGGATAYAAVVIVLITAFIAGIAVRTVVAVIRGQLPGVNGEAAA